MRVLAVLIALTMVTAPFVGCGVSGSIGCTDRCGTCGSTSDCCGDRVCTVLSSDGQARCSDGNFSCKLEP